MYDVYAQAVSSHAKNQNVWEYNSRDLSLAQPQLVTTSDN